jgi:DNA-binding XRE family transcriptional regulator
MSYAKAIKAARTEAGLSQGKLAALAGCNHTTISHIESGRRKPSLDMVTAIAWACGVPASSIHVAADEGRRVRK